MSGYSRYILVIKQENHVLGTYMGKRSTGVSVNKVFKHPAKTKKRIATKHEMLNARKVAKTPKGKTVK